MRTQRFSFLSRDRAALTAHLQARLGIREPDKLLFRGARLPVTDWLQRCLSEREHPISAAWSPEVYDGPVLQYFPKGPVELILRVSAMSANTLLGLLSGAPYEVAVAHTVYDAWHTRRLGSPVSFRWVYLSEDLGPLGWACVFHEAGLDRIPRRFLEHGPWRTTWLDGSTALVEFHDLGDSADEAREPASVGHMVMGTPMLAAYLDLDHHVYSHDLAGVYVPSDQTHRIVVVDRELSVQEMRDAAVFRVRNRAHPERPVRQVVFVFPKQEQALPVRTQLWLRGLECRVIDDQGVERTLDEAPPIERPAWVSRPFVP